MYHLKNCGLPNVWLENGYTTGEDKFGPYYSVEDMSGLYKAIALALAHGGDQLSGDELRVIRRQLKLTQAGIADKLRRSEQTVLLWERHGKIPRDAARQIKLFVLRSLLPSMRIDDAFLHVEQPRPDRIVLIRHQGKWQCSIYERENTYFDWLDLVLQGSWRKEVDLHWATGELPMGGGRIEKNMASWNEMLSGEPATIIETKCVKRIPQEAPQWTH